MGGRSGHIGEKTQCTSHTRDDPKTRDNHPRSMPEKCKFPHNSPEWLTNASKKSLVRFVQNEIWFEIGPNPVSY